MPNRLNAASRHLLKHIEGIIEISGMDRELIATFKDDEARWLYLVRLRAVLVRGIVMEAYTNIDEALASWAQRSAGATPPSRRAPRDTTSSCRASARASRRCATSPCAIDARRRQVRGFKVAPKAEHDFMRSDARPDRSWASQSDRAPLGPRVLALRENIRRHR